MRVLESYLDAEWKKLDESGQKLFPHEVLYKIIRETDISKHFQKDPKTSWMIAAAEKNLPIFVPGWEDSTTGNMYAGRVMLDILKTNPVKRKKYIVVDVEGNMEEKFLDTSILG